MDVELLKCVLCRRFPEGQVYECGQWHVGCQSCVEKLNVKLCKCSEYFDNKTMNPIERLVKHTVKAPCPYKKSGCTWVFDSSDMRLHLEECKFRPTPCIIYRLNVLSCPWQGLQFSMEDHLLEDHKELGNPFCFFQNDEIPFSTEKSRCALKPVNAFNKISLFYFSSNVRTKMAYFMIIYFGRREEARQYYYELSIRAQSEREMPRVKFIQNCVADCEDLHAIMANEQCVTISFKALENYVHDGKIFFRFVVKKHDKVNADDRKPAVVPDEVLTKQKPKPQPFNFAQKGKLKSNLSRSTSTGSASSAGGRSGGGGSGGADKKPSPTAEDSPLRKTSAPSRVAGAGNVDISELSSINRMGVSGQDSPIIHQETTPLNTPSINRFDAHPPSYTALSSSDFRQSASEHCPSGGTNRPPPVEGKTTASLCRMYTQPYKTKDDRLYLQRYPQDCLSKPAFKR